MLWAGGLGHVGPMRGKRVNLVLPVGQYGGWVIVLGRALGGAKV